MVEEAVSLEPVRVVGGFRTATQTNVRDGGVVGVAGVKRLSEGVTGDHAKSIGECGNLFTSVTGSSKIVG